MPGQPGMAESKSRGKKTKQKNWTQQKSTMLRQRARRKEKAVPDAFEINPLFTEVHLNSADEVLPLFPWILQETGTHNPCKAPGHSMNAASSTT